MRCRQDTGSAWHRDSNTDQDSGDGRHISYLNCPDRWRHLDPDLFDSLHQIVSSSQPQVHALEASNILPGATFASSVIPTMARSINLGKLARNGRQERVPTSPQMTAKPSVGVSKPGRACPRHLG